MKAKIKAFVNKPSYPSSGYTLFKLWRIRAYFERGNIYCGGYWKYERSIGIDYTHPQTAEDWENVDDETGPDYRFSRFEITVTKRVQVT